MANKYAEHSKADIGLVYQRVAGSAKMCLRKTSFATEQAAAKRATEITAEGTPMRVYHCPHCHAWHLTSRAAGSPRNEAPTRPISEAIQAVKVAPGGSWPSRT